MRSDSINSYAFRPHAKILGEFQICFDTCCQCVPSLSTAPAVARGRQREAGPLPCQQTAQKLQPATTPYEQRIPDERFCFAYSARKASTGSTAAARREGR